MKFSIITCVYNNNRTLERAIESVYNQRNVEVEYIIIDGGSVDGSLEIIKNFELRILNSKLKTQNSKLIFRFISEKDNGIYDALNKGIKMAEGDVIGLLHADDLFASDNVLEKVEKVFNEKNVKGVYGNLDYVSKEDAGRRVRRWKSGVYKKDKLIYGWMPPHPTLFLKKEVFENYGYYNDKLCIAADYEFILRILYESSIELGYADETITLMRTGGKSNKSFRNIIMKSKEDYLALRMNNVRFVWFTLVCKNLRKLVQFF